ncbi:MAG: polysaccharide pyruvyl transferase family protein [bacterium]
MKLCISGSFGNMDIGDEAMLTEDLDFISNVLKISREDICLIGHQPDYMAFFHSHPRDRCFPSEAVQSNCQYRSACRRDRAAIFLKSALRARLPFRRDIKRIAGECRALLITGGGTINTRNPEGSSIARMHALVSYFKNMGKPVFMSGQTIGPLGLMPRHDEMAREIISAADVLTVRDSFYSRRYLEVINAEPKELMETCDDAYALPYKDEILPPGVQSFLSSGEVAAVNVTTYTSETSSMRVFVAELCERMVRDLKLKVILTSHTEKDYFNLMGISDMLDNSAKGAVLLPDTRFWKDKTLKKMISCCRVAIGGRYHFIVFAGTSNTPFVGMCGNHYSYIKQDGFARAVGLENFILSEKDTWNMEVVLGKTREALGTRLDVESGCQRPSASMRRFGEWLRSLEN